MDQARRPFRQLSRRSRGRVASELMGTETHRLDMVPAVKRVWVRRTVTAVSVLTAVVLVLILVELIVYATGRRPLLDSALSETRRVLQPVSAILLGTSALAIRMSLLDRARRTRTARRVGAALAVFGIVSGLYYLGAYWLGTTGFIPLSMRPALPSGDTYAGLPASNTAYALVLLNTSALLLASPRRWLAISGQAVAVAAVGVAAQMFVLFLYGASSLGSFPFRRSEMAVSVAVCLILLGVAAILSRWDVGVVSALVSAGPGGTVLRATLPAIVAIPVILLGLVQTQPILERPRLFGLMAVVIIGLALLAFMALGRVLDRRDQERTVALERALRARDALDQNAPAVAILEKRLSTLEPIDIEGLDMVTRSRSEEGVLAGDAHAVVKLDPHRAGLVLVDAAGHGALPAVAALRLKDCLVHALRSGASPARAITDAGPLLDDSDSMATAVVADLDDQGRLRCAVAGHPSPVVVRPSGLSLLEATGPLLHTSVDGRWENHMTTLEPGELLLIYSDGLTELATSEGHTTDSDALVELLADLRAASSIDDMAEWLLDPGRNKRFRDDVTLLVARRTAVRAPAGPAESPPPATAAPRVGRYFTEFR